MLMVSQIIKISRTWCIYSCPKALPCKIEKLVKSLQGINTHVAGYTYGILEFYKISRMEIMIAAIPEKLRDSWP